MADTFINTLYGDLSNNEGNNGQNIETGALSDKSFIKQYSNRLFGAPFQLLDSVDRRFPEINEYLGNEYLRNFILNSPILHIRPGMPHYTGDKDSTSLSATLSHIYQDVISEASNMNLGEAVVKEVGGGILFGSGKRLQSRMFGFKETYYEYIQNVNYMCRTVASFMSLIGDFDKEQSIYRSEYPDGCHVSGGQNQPPKWVTFDVIDWQDYRMMAETNVTDPSQQLKEYGGVIVDDITGLYKFPAAVVENLFEGEDIQAAWEEAVNQTSSSSFLGVINSKISSVEFMVKPVSFTETLSNTTGQSMIEGTIDGMRDSVGSELAWITNSTADSSIIDNFVNFLGDGLSSVSEVVGGLVQGVDGGFTRNLFSGAIASLRGQKMIYPSIYKSSRSEMNYGFSITLSTPYGDPYNYYMNIVVPLMHLIALAAPRMVSSNTVSSPFLVQAYIPGMCTCQLGIIQNMRITKNPTTKHVSVNGYPLTIQVDFEIEELYNALSISPANDPASFKYNETLNDYLCNAAGLAPSIDSYVAQRQATIQAQDRWADKGLWYEDLFNMGVEVVENHFGSRR